MLKDKLKTIFLIILGILLAISIFISGFLFIQKQSVEKRESAARISAQNRIAELSKTIQENDDTWSRLSQQNQIELNQLTDENSNLSELIKQRDQRIIELTKATATIRTVRVVVHDAQQTEPEPGRLRVDFDQVVDNFWHINGFTLTNPGEANIELSFSRPAHFTVVATQNPDLSWQTYITSDIPNLEIQNIDSTINPLAIQTDDVLQKHWYDGIYLGIGLAVAVTGNSGFGNVEIGYDFGNIELGIQGSGIAYPGGVDFGVGANIRLNVFDF